MQLSKNVKSAGVLYLCSMFLGTMLSATSHAADVSTFNCNTLTGSLAATLKLSYNEVSAQHHASQKESERAKAFESSVSKSFEGKMAQVRGSLDKMGLLSEWQDYLKKLKSLSGNQKKNFQMNQGNQLGHKLFSALNTLLPVTASGEMPRREKDISKTAIKIDVTADLSELHRQGLDYTNPYSFLESPSIEVNGKVPAGALTPIVVPDFFVLGRVNLLTGQSDIYVANEAAKASAPVPPLPTYPEFIAYQLHSNGLWADYQKCLSTHHITDPAWISAKQAKPASPDVRLGIEHLALPLNTNKNNSAE